MRVIHTVGTARGLSLLPSIILFALTIIREGATHAGALYIYHIHNTHVYNAMIMIREGATHAGAPGAGGVMDSRF